MPHNAAEARALLFNRKLQEKPVEFSLPGLEELDGELSVLELKASELKQCEKLAEGPDGEADEILMMAAVVCKSLVMRATKERLFSDTDMGTINYATGEGSGVAAFGLVVLKPLSDLASQASGIGIDLLAETKKKLQAAQSNGSQNSSTGNSGQPDQGLQKMNSLQP